MPGFGVGDPYRHFIIQYSMLDIGYSSGISSYVDFTSKDGIIEKVFQVSYSHELLLIEKG